MALNRARVSKDIGLTNDGSYTVAVEFFDSANPTVDLWTESFVVSANATTAQLQSLVVARGQQVRTMLANLAAAQAAVPAGTVVPVP